MTPFYRSALIKWRDPVDDAPKPEEFGDKSAMLVIGYFESTGKILPVECMFRDGKVGWYHVRSHGDIDPPTCYATFDQLVPPPEGAFDQKTWSLITRG